MEGGVAGIRPSIPRKQYRSTSAGICFCLLYGEILVKSHLAYHELKLVDSGSRIEDTSKQKNDLSLIRESGKIADHAVVGCKGLE